jgi:hypothetical protein
MMTEFASSSLFPVFDWGEKMISRSLFSFWVVISPQRGAAVVLEVPPGDDGFFFLFLVVVLRRGNVWCSGGASQTGANHRKTQSTKFRLPI